MPEKAVTAEANSRTMRKSKKVHLTLLAGMTLASGQGFGLPSGPAPAEATLFIAPQNQAERGGFGQTLLSDWPLIVAAPLLVAFLIRFGGGE
jgi:hypothetical protein